MEMENTKREPEYPPTCILTGAEGENNDDCATHEHEQEGEEEERAVDPDPGFAAVDRNILGK